MIWQHIRKSRAIGNSLLVTAALLMLISAFNDGIDLASQDYRGALLTAVAAMVFADFLCVHQFLTRRGLARWVAVVIALPSVWIVGDVLRRAPYVWHFK